MDKQMILGSGIGASLFTGLAFICTAVAYGNAPGNITPIVASILFAGFFLGGGIGAIVSFTNAREIPGEVVDVRTDDFGAKKIIVRVWVDRDPRDVYLDRFFFTKLPRNGDRIVIACYNQGSSKQLGPIKEVCTSADVEL